MLCASQYLLIPHFSLLHAFQTARLNFTVTHPISVYALTLASHANKAHLNSIIDNVRGSVRSQIEVSSSQRRKSSN